MRLALRSKQVLLTAARVLTPSSTFLQIEGTENAEIVIDGGDLSRSSSVLAFKQGAEKKSVKVRR